MLSKSLDFNQVNSQISDDAISPDLDKSYHFFAEGLPCNDLEFLTKLQAELRQIKTDNYPKRFDEGTKKAIKQINQQLDYLDKAIEDLKFENVLKYLKTNQETSQEDDLVLLAAMFEMSVSVLKHRLQLRLQLHKEQNDDRPNPSPIDNNERELQKSENAEPSQSLQEDGLRSPTSVSSGEHPRAIPEKVRTRAFSDGICHTSGRESLEQSPLEPGNITQERSKLKNLLSSHSTEKKEERRLAELETVIAEGLGAFYKVGLALKEIRDRKLYKKTHSNFKAYCEEKWGLKRTYAFYQIEAAQTVENLKTFTIVNQLEDKNVHNCEPILPKNESQVRPLANLTPEQQAIVWAEASLTAPHGRITASHIKETLKKMTQTTEQKKEIVLNPGDRVIVQDSQSFGIVQSTGENTADVKVWGQVQTQLKANLKPLSSDSILVCGVVNADILEIVNANYGSLEFALYDLLVEKKVTIISK